MIHLKGFKKFEDAMANATTAGAGAVVSVQPGALPGTFGTNGSGDIGFTFKKEKRKKGSPSEVSDARDLEDNPKIGDEFGIEKVEESFEHESIDGTPVVTYKMVIDAAKSGVFDDPAEQYLPESINYLIDYLERNIAFNIERNDNDLTNKPIGYQTGTESFIGIDESLGLWQFVVILKSGQPHALLHVGEMMNPFEFGDIVVAPGRDYILCYNLKTDERKKAYIR